MEYWDRLMESRLIDVHAHLHDEAFRADRHEVVGRLDARQYVAIINAGTDLENSRQALKLAEQHPNFWALAGFHPHEARLWDDHSAGEIEKLLGHQKVIGLGEIGLDYHYDHSPRNIQQEVFLQQWDMAARLQIPAVIHVREAFDDFFSLIAGRQPPPRIMLHCFSGDLEIARKALDHGFEFSVGGALTFKKNEIARTVFAFLPIEAIHLETDCPYLAPEPFRGKRCDPGHLVYTLRKLALIRRTDEAGLARSLEHNARRFFAPKLQLAD